MFKKKPQEAPNPEPVEEYTPEYIDFAEAERKEKVAAIEGMMDDALDHFFTAQSPNNPQEVLAVLRLEDFYRIICRRLGIDPKSTKYKVYEND